MAKKPMKAPPKGGKVVKRAMGGPMPQGLQPGGPPPGMPSQSAMNQMGGIPVAAAQAAQLQQMARGFGGGPPPPPVRRAGGMGGVGAGSQVMKKGGKVKKMASGGSTKKRPYDAMRDESSRAIDAMPYTETKPKPPPKKAEPKKAEPKKPAPKTRPYDHVKDEPTSRPFKKGGKAKAKAKAKTKKRYV